jgi:Leucine-rich repeat (LRR) protein
MHNYILKNEDLEKGRLKEDVVAQLKKNKIKRFICDDNTYIKEIPKINSIEYLNCSGSRVKVLPTLPRLVHLECARTKIKTLAKAAKAQKLEFLDITGCRQLKKLPNYIKLKFLYCSGCRIEKIPNYTLLEDLDCSLCNKLEGIPYLKNLNELKCSNCKIMNSVGITDIKSYKNYVQKVYTLQILLKYSRRKKFDPSLIRHLSNYL